MLTLIRSFLSMNKTKPENGEKAAGRRKRRKRRRRRRDRNKHRNNILKMPDDITVEIFSKLPIKTLIHCRCVCKSWRQSLLDPIFTKSIFSRPPACLFVDYRRGPGRWKERKHILVDIEGVLIPNDMVLKLSNPNALYNRYGTMIIGSCNGFLCLRRYNYKLKTDIFNISNPITGESIPLPVDEKFVADRYPVDIGFGFSPISDVYKVVMFETYRSKRWKGSQVKVLTVGCRNWRSIGKVYASFVTRYGVFHNGFLHWICKSKRPSRSLFIRAFDVETERFKDMQMPSDSRNDAYESEIQIGVLRGSLSITSCNCSNHTLSVWVMKEHGIAKSWTKELEIGDISDWNGTDNWYWSSRLKSIQVLKFLDEGEVLLFDRVKMYPLIYTTATRNLSRVEVDGKPLENMRVVATGIVPSFVSPKDIIRNYISKHPEQQVGTSSAMEVSDIKLPAWTTSVAGWGENEESELLEIPRGQPTPCLPLPDDFKYVSSTTAASLLDMISGLNDLLVFKCMAVKDEIQRLRKENEYLRARARLPLEGKMPVQMICYLMALIILLFMSYLALK